MSQPAEMSDPNTTIPAAARQMWSLNIRALPVGENNCLIGMVTDRDIVINDLGEEVDLHYKRDQ